MAIMPVDEGDGSGHHERQVRPAERRQPADGRPDDEADAERRAQHAEKTRAVRRRGDVRDRALGHGHAGPGHPVDDPAGEQHPQRTGGAGDEAPDGGPEQRQEQDRLAADAIGKPSEQGRAHELGRRERGHQQPDLDAAGPEALGVPAAGSAP